MSLLRMRPGGVSKAHRHTKDEEFVVLEGECHIGTHVLSAGDIHRTYIAFEWQATCLSSDFRLRDDDKLRMTIAKKERLLSKPLLRGMPDRNDVSTRRF